MSKKLDKLIDEICSEVEKEVGHRKYVETFLQGIDFSSVDEGIIDEDYEYASDRLDDVFYYYKESLNDDKYFEKYGDIFTDKVVKLLNELKKELSKFTESKKSMKESINGDCYIYYDDDDNKRLVFCDYVKGITDTRDWFYLNEYIIDAIHVFKNEKQAQKFIDEHLKYFADQDKVVIAEYPQTVGGFFESKKSVRKSLKEERYNVELSDYSGSIVDEETFDKKSDAIQWAKDNGRNCYARIWDNEEGKTVKEWKVKSIKESADDNWYKLKVLNEMLDAMEDDEYNIPKLGIYGVTKNINLDKGAIEALIKYYK